MTTQTRKNTPVLKLFMMADAHMMDSWDEYMNEPPAPWMPADEYEVEHGVCTSAVARGKRREPQL